MVLDLFASSGQMGLEMLSRGASGCVFMDQKSRGGRPDPAESPCRGQEEPSLAGNAQVLNLDALAYSAGQKDRFDIAFSIPPMRRVFWSRPCGELARHMNPGGVIVCESDAGLTLPEQVENFALERTYRYGRVHLRLYRRQDAQLEESLPEKDGRGNENSHMSGQL